MMPRISALHIDTSSSISIVRRFTQMLAPEKCSRRGRVDWLRDTLRGDSGVRWGLRKLGGVMCLEVRHAAARNQKQGEKAVLLALASGSTRPIPDALHLNL
jgi:hypothetical protein